MTRMAVALAAAGLALGGCASAGTPTSATPDSMSTSVSTSVPAPDLAPASPTAPAAAAPAAQVRPLDPADFEAAEPGRLLINVHIPDEGSLPGTDLALPYNEIDARTADLPADRSTPLAIYCMSGNMSAIAGRELTALGYTDVVELDGGMQAWQASGRTLLPAGG